MRSVFLGDSITAGENNNDTSFVDYMCGTTYNLGISGTTIGEYSIYPVDGNSMLGVIDRHKELLKSADMIFIEYGLNDVAAIMCGFATVQTVTVSFVKALDWIRQLNPTAPIYFLSMGPKKSKVATFFAASECAYLVDDYFGDYDFKFPLSVYVQTYFDILMNISKKCDIICMFDDDTFDEEKHLSNDGIHPSDEGHRLIAQKLVNRILF